MVIKFIFADSLYDIQLLPLGKHFYILVRDFSSLFLAKIDKDSPASETDFIRFRDGIVHDFVCFPRSLDPNYRMIN